MEESTVASSAASAYDGGSTILLGRGSSAQTDIAAFTNLDQANLRGNDSAYASDHLDEQQHDRAKRTTELGKRRLNPVESDTAEDEAERLSKKAKVGSAEAGSGRKREEHSSQNSGKAIEEAESQASVQQHLNSGSRPQQNSLGSSTRDATQTSSDTSSSALTENASAADSVKTRTATPETRAPSTHEPYAKLRSEFEKLLASKFPGLPVDEIDSKTDARILEIFNDAWPELSVACFGAETRKPQSDVAAFQSALQDLDEREIGYQAERFAEEVIPKMHTVLNALLHRTGQSPAQGGSPLLRFADPADMDLLAPADAQQLERRLKRFQQGLCETLLAHEMRGRASWIQNAGVSRAAAKRNMIYHSAQVVWRGDGSDADAENDNIVFTIYGELCIKYRYGVCYDSSYEGFVGKPIEQNSGRSWRDLPETVRSGYRNLEAEPPEDTLRNSRDNGTILTTREWVPGQDAKVHHAIDHFHPHGMPWRYVGALAPEGVITFNKIIHRKATALMEQCVDDIEDARRDLDIREREREWERRRHNAFVSPIRGSPQAVDTSYGQLDRGTDGYRAADEHDRRRTQTPRVNDPRNGRDTHAQQRADGRGQRRNGLPHGASDALREPRTPLYVQPSQPNNDYEGRRRRGVHTQDFIAEPGRPPSRPGPQPSGNGYPGPHHRGDRYRPRH